jgi:hypothetical protein
VHPTGEGKRYCCLIKDVFSNRIVDSTLTSVEFEFAFTRQAATAA